MRAWIKKKTATWTWRTIALVVAGYALYSVLKFAALYYGGQRIVDALSLN